VHSHVGLIGAFRGALILRADDQPLVAIVRARRQRFGPVAAFMASMSIGIAGCASAGSPTSSVPSPPLHLYRVKLTGKAATPVGAANGTGYAIIAIHRGSIVCWRFAHLHGFLDATVAQIHDGLQGRSGKTLLPLSTGPKLQHRGCVKVGAAAITAIERAPSHYYVIVHSQQYPSGAVRGQL
jgi:CHRD domain